jgi:hypothetical protein
MLTVVDERQGIPLAVVKGGKPAKGDTIWLGGAPYCVTGYDRDVVLVKLGSWQSPNCATGTQMRRRALYAVNPSPSRLAGYRNPPVPEDLPQYSRGPIFQPGYQTSPFPQAYTPFIPQVGPPPTFEQPVFQQPSVYLAYHYQYRFPVFKLTAYRTPQVGERDIFQGIEYEYTYIGRNYVLVRPVVPWVGFVVAEDRRTGDGLAWAPLTSMNQISNVKQWLKRRLLETQGTERAVYHLHKKSGRQLKRYFRENPPKGLPVFRRP